MKAPLAVPLAQARGAGAGGPWEVPLMTSRRRRHGCDVRRRDIGTGVAAAGLSNAPTAEQRTSPPRATSEQQ
ncbi:hypothetical protein JYU34_002506 [Plutella xylostella]|uniref:Uncharacterized protein n=2 Tax=Plutella xylostella TaxID=51655 RepID=A0ABQ7R2E4_PLUXY|nr:hypothetical protein JYU34_002506 [Plutella xylostella]